MKINVKLVLEEAEFDIGRELEGLVDMFSMQCKNHDVETVIDLSDDMPKVVLGDSARVVHIFANLIINSIKLQHVRAVFFSITSSSFMSTEHGVKKCTDKSYVPEAYKSKARREEVKVVCPITFGRVEEEITRVARVERSDGCTVESSEGTRGRSVVAEFAEAGEWLQSRRQQSKE
ncbi:hypothetical protein SSX86_032677 [Deinandra increscens subsp. villosa]|uniref:histidine kinase n=1 Tax=Deinandra increscens subsp. villosa TaxID=3103831 RepID=A0AAP0GHI7_9ASTR